MIEEIKISLWYGSGYYNNITSDDFTGRIKYYSVEDVHYDSNDQYIYFEVELDVVVTPASGWWIWKKPPIITRKPVWIEDRSINLSIFKTEIYTCEG